MRTQRYELLRPGELLAEQQRFSCVYVPFGPIEWHSVHNPMGLDALNAQTLALRAAEITGGVALPTLFIGTECIRDETARRNIGFTADDPPVEGMDFPKNSFKSLYYREETLALVLRDTVRLLARAGYRLIVLLNAHGATGQLHVIDALLRDFAATLPGCRVICPNTFCAADPSLGGGHATGSETSLMCYQYPDTVDLSLLPPKPRKLYGKDWGFVDGVTFAGQGPEDGSVLDDPRDSNAARGEADTKAALDSVVAAVRSAYAALDA